MEEEEEEEEEQEESREPVTLEEIEALAAESRQSLYDQTGANLPRLALTPLGSERRVVCVPLEIELPLGSLFYPCCGSDIEHAVTSFGSCVTDCHFADPYNPAHGRSRPRPQLKPLFIPHIETVVVGGHKQKRIDKRACPVYSHEKDGLLTLIDDVPHLSIFYYRGDSYGEGGSNQRWLEPVLFHTVLARLLDGGLIAASGSNCGSGRDDKSVPWSSLCGGSAIDDAKQYFQSGEPHLPRRLVAAALIVRKLYRGEYWGGQNMKNFLHVGDLANGRGVDDTFKDIAADVANTLRLKGLLVAKYGDGKSGRKRQKYALNSLRRSDVIQFANELTCSDESVRNSFARDKTLLSARFLDGWSAA